MQNKCHRKGCNLYHTIFLSCQGENAQFFSVLLLLVVDVDVCLKPEGNQVEGQGNKKEIAEIISLSMIRFRGKFCSENMTVPLFTRSLQQLTLFSGKYHLDLF